MKFRAVLPALAICLISTTFAAAENAGEVVKDTSARVIERLKAEKPQLDANPERIYEIINDLIIPHFDFSSMSRWVLGNFWREATAEQRQQFVDQFRTLLVRTYARALLEYSENNIRYYPEERRPDSNLAVVKTEVEDSNGGNPIPIDYRMHAADGVWRVVDVAVDGVSLVSTYRGSFASEIRKNGLDSLIAKLTDRNAKSEAAPVAETILR